MMKKKNKHEMLNKLSQINGDSDSGDSEQGEMRNNHDDEQISGDNDDRNSLSVSTNETSSAAERCTDGHTVPKSSFVYRGNRSSTVRRLLYPSTNSPSKQSTPKQRSINSAKNHGSKPKSTQKSKRRVSEASSASLERTTKRPRLLPYDPRKFAFLILPDRSFDIFKPFLHQ